MPTTGNVLHSIAGHQLKYVDNFKYLGSYVSDSMEVSIPGKEWHGQHVLSFKRCGPLAFLFGTPESQVL